MNDEHGHMRAALALAARGLGRVAPNPAVGCVIVRPAAGRADLVGGRVVGRGWTRPGGRPHAETEALAMAGPAARGATVFVTLEPCAHHGRTPPCAEALAAAGVARVVAAARDPDPRVDGKGLARLAAAGVATTTPGGAVEAAARWLNRGYFCARAAGRPWVTWKAASGLDGRIALADGAPRAITGEAAWTRTHVMRAEADAILTGLGTVLADDPALTCRLPGLRERSPLRVVADSHAAIPPGAKLVTTARAVPTLILARADADAGRIAALRAAGVAIAACAVGADGRIDVADGLRALAARGVTRLMVECGGGLARALLAAGLVDEIDWRRAPRVLGGDARPAVDALGLGDLAAAPRFRRVALQTLGDDVVETLIRADPPAGLAPPSAM